MSWEYNSAAVDRPGAEVLYTAATAFERALAETSAEELLSIKAELIIENWDPWAVQSKNIPYLAWAMGVSLWDETWPEVARRYWMDVQWKFKAKRGTREAMEMALGMMPRPDRHVGLLNLITPPARFILGRQRTPEEEETLMGRLPEVRIFPYALPTPAPYSSFFAPGFFRNETLWHVRANTANLRNEHRAEIWRDGIKTDLQVAQLFRSPLEEDTEEFERLYFPSPWKGSRMLGLNNVTYQRWRGKSSSAKFVVSFKSSPTKVGGQAVVHGEEPAEAMPRMVFEVHSGGKYKLFYSRPRRPLFRVRSDAADHVYRALRLWEPDSLGATTRGRSYWGRARRGIGPFKAIAALKVPIPRVARKRFRGAPMHGFLAAQNLVPLNAALIAIQAAKAARDTILIDTDLYFEQRFYRAEG